MSPGATYAIGESEVVSEDGEIVHVATTWSETGADGSTSSEDILWVVRLDPEGWRVVGMAMLIFTGEPPLLLNFEDPDDMLAKQEQVVRELQRRARQKGSEARTARSTGNNPRLPRMTRMPSATKLARRLTGTIERPGSTETPPQYPPGRAIQPAPRR